METSLDFDGVNSDRYNLHSFFRFPGSFHPPLIEHILNQHQNASVIGDPMSGSGCVAVEAISKNMDILNMDIDPLSYLITRAKTQYVDPIEYSSTIHKILKSIEPFTAVKEYSLKEVNEYIDCLNNTKYNIPYNAYHWFDNYVIISLSKILSAISDLALNEDILTAVEATVASIIRKVSRADPQPVSGLEITKIRKKQLERGLKFNVENEFLKKSNILTKGYEYYQSLPSIGKSTVIEGNLKNDWLEYCSDKDIYFDIIITSPPYCNAIEYWRRHRLEYFWLGLLTRNEIIEKSRNFIGSTTLLKAQRENIESINIPELESKIEKIKNKGKLKKSQILQKYFSDANIWISNTLHTLKKNGVAYFVVGPSTSYGVQIDTPEYLSQIIRDQGFTVKNFITYAIKNQRMQYPTHNDIRIRTETVLKIST